VVEANGGIQEPVVRAGVGLALGGGVLYSVAGVGVARVLMEARIPIAAVAGTSGGAIVGAAIASGMRDWELRQAAEEMDWGDLVRFSPGRMGVFNGDRIQRFIEEMTGCRTFEDLKLPFTAVTTDILVGREVRLKSGPLGVAVQASCSIPGLFQPVKLGEMMLVDGGIMDNLPVRAVQEHRPAVTLAVDVLTVSDAYQGRLRTGAHVILKAYHTLIKRKAELQESLADLTVMPNVSGFSVLNFRDAVELMARGEDAARPMISHLRAMLAERIRDIQTIACPL